MISAKPVDLARVELRQLREADAAALSAFLSAERRTYLRNFFPFRFDPDGLADILRRAKKDRYWGVYFGSNLTGLSMLRGLDEGYARPSFGLIIGERFAGRGFGRHALNFALDWCRRNGIREVMLKVSEDNLAALTIYRRAGFVATGRCPDTGQLIHELSLDPC